MVSYDRIYEHDNLANEMVEGERVDYSFLQSLREMSNSRPDEIGHIYVKYLDPIDLQQYLKKNVPNGLSSDNLEAAAQLLTNDLMERQ